MGLRLILLFCVINLWNLVSCQVEVILPSNIKNKYKGKFNS
jgi:hypothetical protein